MKDEKQTPRFFLFSVNTAHQNIGTKAPRPAQAPEKFQISSAKPREPRVGKLLNQSFLENSGEPTPLYSWPTLWLSIIKTPTELLFCEVLFCFVCSPAGLSRVCDPSIAAFWTNELAAIQGHSPSASAGAQLFQSFGLHMRCPGILRHQRAVGCVSR
jgi:hypothetical protein